MSRRTLELRHFVWLVALTLALTLALPRGVDAQTPSVRAYVSPGTTIGVGRPFNLNVEVSGAQSVDRDPQLPDLGRFAQYLGSNTQSSVQMVNGRTTVTLTIQYRYQALAEGAFEIPSFEVSSQGQAFQTEPISLTVSAAPPEDTRNEAGIGPNDLFITAESSASSVREGEPFIVEYRIWTRVDVRNFGMTRVPEPEGFWVEDVTPQGQPEVEQRTRDGQQYATAVIRRVALVPTGAGPRTIEAIGVEAQVRVQGGRDPFRDFFGRSSLFGSTTVPTTVLSNELTVDVEPLPSGRPEPFTGVVGRLEVAGDLDRDSVDANEAVTLTIRVSGTGNLRTITAPELDFPPDFEVFPPEMSESVTPTATGLAGSKTFEYVLIPRAPGSREVPSARFSFLDAEAGGYRTVETGALPLTVSGEIVEGPAALARGGVAQLREDIRFIRLGSLELRRPSGPLLGGAGFWIFALLPLVGIVGAVGLRRHWDLLEGDVAYARGRRASRVAKRRLAEARRLAGEDDSRAFHAEVARALRGLVADRLNLAEAGLQTRELDQALTSAGIDANTREALQDCLDHCDRERFAPGNTGSEERTRLLERAASLMTALDRAVR